VKGRVSSGSPTFLISRPATATPPMRGSSELRSLSSSVVRVNVAAWGVDPLLAKPDRTGSSPWETVTRAGHTGRGIVRDCPLGTGQDRCEWHASGTAGAIDSVQPGGVGSTVTRRVRPVPGDHCLVGKPRTRRGRRQCGWNFLAMSLDTVVDHPDPCPS
jgi:hypothetical protein